MNSLADYNSYNFNHIKLKHKKSIANQSKHLLETSKPQNIHRHQIMSINSNNDSDDATASYVRGYN